MFEAALPLQAITIHEQQTTNNEPIKFSKRPLLCTLLSARQLTARSLTTVRGQWASLNQNSMIRNIN